MVTAWLELLAKPALMVYTQEDDDYCITIKLHGPCIDGQDQFITQPNHLFPPWVHDCHALEWRTPQMDLCLLHSRIFPFKLSGISNRTLH